MNDWLGLIGLNWRPDRKPKPGKGWTPGDDITGKGRRDEYLCHLQAAASESLRLAESRHVLAEHDQGWRARMWEEVRRGEDWRERFRRVKHMDLLLRGETWEANYTVKLATHWK